MRSRGIHLNQLTGAIRKPTHRNAGNTQYTEIVERDFPGGKYLAVVIEEQSSVIRVVTTYWGTR